MQNIIIIGAGPAGLTAAYELIRSGEKYAVTVLEESQEFGGISRTVRYNGNRMDIGGHRFFSGGRNSCPCRARRPWTTASSGANLP